VSAPPTIAPSSGVIDGTQVKVLVCYDDEWGYVNRMMEFAVLMA
jgi:glyceraldehyde 3-phosphate dehydrogenase